MQSSLKVLSPLVLALLLQLPLQPPLALALPLPPQQPLPLLLQLPLPLPLLLALLLQLPLQLPLALALQLPLALALPLPLPLPLPLLLLLLLFKVQLQQRNDLVTSEISSINTTSSSSYDFTFTAINNTDIEGQESTTSPVLPKNSSFVRIFLGTLAGVICTILIVTVFIKRNALRERLARRSNTSGTTTSVYLNLSDPDGYVRLDNIRDRSSSA
ncbi:unnamed protein product [Rotaria magnacalcarata]|uniref:Uncharacterized protein n=1 Tax=Rotaria magnacalcarata TaxID=392030 RepID=A0A815BAD8_9BILA|nr:unnamed protein product [Rotaria magnacalcarata]CAF1514717.1 unnamed protein product [Rotaria magnacalcarata]